MKKLAKRVLGTGQKAPEALFNTIEGYAKSKGGGKDIATLAKVMASIPEDLRGNFRNTFIRRIGTGLKGDFSAAKFADEWLTKINPQAKAVLFGDGAHVKALDRTGGSVKEIRSGTEPVRQSQRLRSYRQFWQNRNGDGGGGYGVVARAVAFGWEVGSPVGNLQISSPLPLARQVPRVSQSKCSVCRMCRRWRMQPPPGSRCAI